MEQESDFSVKKYSGQTTINPQKSAEEVRAVCAPGVLMARTIYLNQKNFKRHILAKKWITRPKRLLTVIVCMAIESFY